MSAAPEASPTLAQFARFVRRNIGLNFPPDRLPELRQKIAAAAAAYGSGELERYLLRLMSEPLSRERRDQLVRTLAIGETYFLRDPKSYQVLSGSLLPELIASRRSTDRSIRIWSAGCSTGEEPYSIAILLARAVADLDKWNITLLGTDINRDALEQARRGLYREWSFRNAPPWLKDYFTRRPDNRNEIAPFIRKMVRFQELNLAGDGEAANDSVGRFDIIFCRNVMLYFDQRQIARTMARFHRALVPGGCLFVAPSEVCAPESHGFKVECYDGALVLRKAVSSSAPLLHRRQKNAITGKHRTATDAERHKSPVSPKEVPSPAPVTPVPVGDRPDPGAARGAQLEAAAELYASGRYLEAAETALGSLCGADDADGLALSARAYANVGRFAEARDCCVRAIACDRLRADHHYLLSIIMEQLGDTDAAVRSLKDALFVDHDHVLAYVALGNLYRQSGERREAERNYANALRLLEKRDPHEVLPEAEGMTAGRLAEMIKRRAKG